ncbi:exodeoxyribonuclease I [Endozoicomonas atrinae]|uniref:exodeoxyribonuclease I n=1 Tax=Endozoicomonas atrinae TaxID=1333660 RepID=UPI000825F8AE|nr:exodeoxyribonuclease I [Endozoicomonas atrinae]
MNSFYFHDYETFGADPALDWPAQFAGIRTDTELNEVGQPLNIFCKLPEDHLPNPMACLVTGLTPQKVNEQGVVEPEFIRSIHTELMVPGTCALGYNTIRFDDEVTRNILYRNFYDPYAREWQNGNSRWDLIDLVRLTAALRPEGIEWPLREDGFKSFRLEEITAANGIDHGSAHDALSDVRATIALARLVRQRQPRVFQFYLSHRGKREVAGLLNLVNQQMVVHVSGMFGAQRHNLAVVMPLIDHPVNRNGIVVYDLSVDPEPLLNLSVEDIRRRLFTPADQLGDGEERIPLKTIHINKCPAVAPLAVLRAEDQDRLEINLARCEVHRNQLMADRRLTAKLKEVFSESLTMKHTDPDQMIYSGGFFSPADKNEMSRILTSNPSQLSQLGLSFSDKRLEEMLFRYRGRHYFETMDGEDQGLWKQYCRDRLSGQLNPENTQLLTFDHFWNELGEAQAMAEGEPKKQHILAQLSDYVRQHENALFR